MFSSFFSRMEQRFRTRQGQTSVVGVERQQAARRRHPRRNEGDPEAAKTAQTQVGGAAQPTGRRQSEDEAVFCLRSKFRLLIKNFIESTPVVCSLSIKCPRGP